MTPDIVGLYSSISHKAGLNALKNDLDDRKNKTIYPQDLIKLASFVLKNNLFEFNGKVKHQISGTAIGTNFHQAMAAFL